MENEKQNEWGDWYRKTAFVAGHLLLLVVGGLVYFHVQGGQVQFVPGWDVMEEACQLHEEQKAQGLALLKANERGRGK